MDAIELIRQIGWGNHMAISGLRWGTSGTGDKVTTVHFPVGHGYRVDIELAADDTYTVRRVFSRKPRNRAPVETVKGERTGVYADDIGKVARYAASYESYDENEWPHQA